MSTPYVVTGTLSNGRLVELDEALPLGDVKVRVTIEPILPRQLRPLREFLDEIHARQRARGHIPPTREEVDRYLDEERASWD